MKKIKGTNMQYMAVSFFVFFCFFLFFCFLLHNTTHHYQALYQISES